MGLTETDADDVIAKVKQWEPPKVGKEDVYENSLYQHLNTCFPKETFHRQYSHGKTRADIFVEFDDGARVAIEIKKDLKDRKEFHRLIGQSYEYLTEWKAEIVVVLCGNNDPALTKLTRKALFFFEDALDRKAKFIEKL